MLSRTTPAPAAPIPATYLLAVDGVIQDTQLGFAWRDALDLLWSGDYNAGGPRLLHIDLAAGTSADVTDEALTNLAARTFDEHETPAHLLPLFRAADLGSYAPAHRMTPDPADSSQWVSMATALGRRRALFGAFEG